ncbi:MAG: Bax inhibitor-1/YccA family protein [Desulfuromonas sp.]|nr:Bax inhibitor-1/YccA family protein [Desulfuromonas sp.]
MFADLYTYLALRPRRVMVGYLLFVLFSLSCLLLVEQQENIESLLPDSSQGTVRRDFDWLQKAPFARKILIDLYGDESVTSQQLQQISDALVGALDSPLFVEVLNGPPVEMAPNFFSSLSQALPRLATAEDLQQIDQRLQPQMLQRRLQQIKEQLLTPQGWWTKQQLQHDPLALWQLTAGHLRQLNPMAGAQTTQRGFISADGRHRLVVADSTIDIGDVQGSERLLATVQQALVKAVPSTVTATVVSGHLYTLANAHTIQRDLRVVLGAATVAIILIFIVLLRSRRALYVFILPASVLGVAAGTVALFFPTVSGITIGFGAVLLGITVDFTLHVFFAVRDVGPTARAVQLLSRPLIGGALTSFLAFSVLLRSTLPGQRQLAVFSMTAIVVALILALVVMPHLCGRGDHAMASMAEGRRPHKKPGRIAMWIWLLVLALSAGGLGRLQFDGDLRRLSVATPALQHGEQLLQQVWGNVRGQALLFARGTTLDEALQVNDTMFQQVRQSHPDSPFVSVAALLPSREQQQHNEQRWLVFWAQRQDALTRLTQLAAEQGFSATAFSSFVDGLAAPSPPLDLPFWKKAGLDALIDGLMINGDGKSTMGGSEVAVVSLLDESQLTDELRRNLEKIPGALVVAQGNFRQQLSGQVAADFRTFIFSAMMVVCAVLLLWYRRLKMIVLALLPVGSGLLFMFGCMGWAGLSFNLFNVIAAILIIGLGVDYGIFMLNRCQGLGGRHTDRAVLVSALTTIAGFGSLALARHPAMYSIGVTVLLGISAAVFTALTIVPLGYRWLYPLAAKD